MEEVFEKEVANGAVVKEFDSHCKITTFTPPNCNTILAKTMLIFAKIWLKIDLYDKN